MYSEGYKNLKANGLSVSESLSIFKSIKSKLVCMSQKLFLIKYTQKIINKNEHDKLHGQEGFIINFEIYFNF